ncbi:MAG: CHAT domain-containing protein, partial [Salinivirgaceae bacterium]|nr:CHAT domain-containing protein [Salinivirgaceae bacterium]
MKKLLVFIIATGTALNLFGQYAITFSNYRQIPADTSAFEFYLNTAQNGDRVRAAQIADSLMNVSAKKEKWEEYLFYGNNKLTQYLHLQNYDTALLIGNNVIANCKDHIDTLSVEYLTHYFLIDYIYQVNENFISKYHNSKYIFSLAEARGIDDLFVHGLYQVVVTAAAMVDDFALSNKALLKTDDIINKNHITDKRYLIYQDIFFGYNSMLQDRLDYAAVFYESALNKLDIVNKEDTSIYLDISHGLSEIYKKNNKLEDLYRIEQERLPYILDFKYSDKVANYKDISTIENSHILAMIHYYKQHKNYVKAQELIVKLNHSFYKKSQHVNYIDGLSILANIYLDQEKFNDALICYNKQGAYIDSTDINEAVLKKDYLKNLASLYLKLQKYDSTIAIAQRAIISQLNIDDFNSDIYTLYKNIDEHISDGYFDFLYLKIEAMVFKLKNQPTKQLKKSTSGHLSYYIKSLMANVANEYNVDNINTSQEKINNALNLFLKFKYDDQSNWSPELINAAINFKNLQLKKQIIKTKSENLALMHTDKFVEHKEKTNQLNNLSSSRFLMRQQGASIDSLISQMSKLQKELIRLEVDFNRFSEIKLDSNRLVNCQLSEIQSNLSDNEVIVDFLFTKEFVFTTCISKNSFQAEIQERDRIDMLIKNFVRALKSGAEIDDISSELGSLLLSSFNSIFNGKKQLIIGTDGYLNQLPFELLSQNQSLLVNEFSVSYTPSIPLWLSFKEWTNEITNPVFLGIAPGFLDEKNDLESFHALRSVFDIDSVIMRGGGNLPSLQYTISELNEINKLILKEKTNRSVILSGRNANKEEVLSNLPSANIIHFATHGFVNKDNPYISGLALYSDSIEYLYNNIFYHYELYNIELNANLVVLSACKTGTGKIIEGEGVMALPRGFIYAGVPNVIASLWKVHDEKTKDLMVAF